MPLLTPPLNKPQSDDNETSKLSRLFWDSLTYPPRTALGVAMGAGDLLQGLGGVVTGPIRDLLPESVQRFTSGTPPEPTTLPAGERAFRLFNIVGLGIPGMLRQEFQEQKEQGLTVPRWDRALFKVAWSFLPIEETLMLANNKHPETGEPLPPEEVGRTGFNLALKSIPIWFGVKKGLEATTSKIRPTKDRVPLTRREAMDALLKPEKIIPEEMEVAGVDETGVGKAGTGEVTNVGKIEITGVGKVDVAGTTEAPRTPFVSKEVMDKVQELEKSTGIRFSEQDIIDATIRAGHPVPGSPVGEISKTTHLDPRSITLITQRVIGYYTELAKKEPEKFASLITDTATKMLAHPERYKSSQKIADLVASGMIDQSAIPQYLAEQLVVYGVPASDVIATNAVLAELLEKSGSYYGRGLGAYSALNKAVLQLIELNPEAAQAVRAAAAMWKIPDSYPSLWAKINQNIHRFVRLAKGNMVSQLVTLQRNNIIQGTVGLLYALENAFVDTGLALLGKARGVLTGERVPTWKVYYYPTIASFTDAIASFAATPIRLWQEATRKPVTFRSIYDKIMDAMDPLERQLVEGGPVAGDIAGSSVLQKGYWDRVKRGVKTPGHRLDTSINFITDVLTSANRISELMARQFFWTSALARAIRKYRYMDMTDFLNDLVDESRIPTRFIPFPGKPIPDVAKTVGELRGKLDELAVDFVGKDAIRNARALGGDDAVRRLMESAKVKLSADLNKIHNKLLEGEPELDILDNLDPRIAPYFGGRVSKITRAIDEATEAALRNTFGYSFNPHSFFGKVLKLWSDFPILGPLVHYFPRFLFNMWTWLMDRNPFQLLKLMDSDFRKAFLGELKEASKDPLGRDLSLMYAMGRAAEGVALLSAAHMLRNSSLGGPKYYLVNAGKDEQGNDIYLDMRPYQPFSQILFLVDAMKAVHEGRMPNLTAAELSDAILGIRRLSEVPVFAFVDLVRSIDYRTPDAFIKGLKRMAGQPIAAPFVPMRMIIDAMDSAGLTNSMRDMEGNELFGPAMANIPGLHAALPERIDPYTGKPMKAIMPALRQFTGMAFQKASPLESLSLESNLPPRSLTGQYYTPEANRLVDKYVGEILDTPIQSPQGRVMARAFLQKLFMTDLSEEDIENLPYRNLNEMFSRLIEQRTKGMPIEWRREAIRNLFSELRKIAVVRARLDNPKAFVEYDIRTRLSEPVQRMVRENQDGKR